jgi:hypothetical protein
LTVQPHASAADPAPLEIHKGGELKARATYDDSTNTICVRVFNAPGGSAKAWVTPDQGGTWSATDRGGDTDRHCQKVYAVADYNLENDSARWGVTFTSSSGDTTSKDGTLPDL